MVEVLPHTAYKISAYRWEKVLYILLDKESTTSMDFRIDDIVPPMLWIAYTPQQIRWELSFEEDRFVDCFLYSLERFGNPVMLTKSAVRF